ncbi:glycosyltransferase family 39 protein, partial [Candidatus Fermentibacteria bacterium]|nr:glycosyltransferase family 39 protein [Candidatus Fermentibacteria bacterium]
MRARIALLLIGVASVMAFLINPRGEFPLNDDWLYARVVQQFLDTGRLMRPPLAAVSLVAQTLWGATCSAVFGFSHTTLRLSSVLLYLLAALATAGAVARRAKTSHAAFAGLLILLSPLGLVSAFSFMPEPALAAAVAITVLACVLWEEQQTASRGIGLALAAACAYLVHPVAVVMPLWVLVRAWRRPPVVGSDAAMVSDRSFVRFLPGLAALAGVVPFLVWYLHGTEGTMSGMWISRSSG